MVELAALHIADPPERWERLGFALDRDGSCQVGPVRLRFGHDGEGIVAWELRGIDPETVAIDGLSTHARAQGPTAAAQPHPNGAVGIDHVVVVSPEFERTADALAGAGVPLKRIRQTDTFRQGFVRIGPAILELVEASTATVTAFWGLVVVVEDLERLAHLLGEHLGSIHAAVQPGRRIATVRESAALSLKLAFMDPEAAS